MIGYANLSGKKSAYLDCNATTKVLKKVARAAQDMMLHDFGNPSSSHISGLSAKSILEKSRATMAKFLRCEVSETIFTSGATESINTAVLSSLEQAVVLQEKAIATQQPLEMKILYGATEHKAVIESIHHWHRILRLNAKIERIPVSSEGILDFDFIKSRIDKTVFLSTMAVNNETGVIQPLVAIAELIKAHPKCLWLVDAVQTLGKIDFYPHEIGCHFATFSGHKFFAPKGVGLLYKREDSPFTPLFAGGGQESGLRSGTENISGIVAFAAVVDYYLDREHNGLFASMDTLAKWRIRLWNAFLEAFPDALLNSPLNGSVPTTLNVTIPYIRAKDALDLFDAAGLRLGSGAACGSADAKPSHVLLAMGFDKERSSSALRLSLCQTSTEGDIVHAEKALRKIAHTLNNTCLFRNFRIPDSSKIVREHGVLQFVHNECNAWLLINERTGACAVIDPLEEILPGLIATKNCQKLDFLAVLDTHSHGDHTSNISGIAKNLNAPDAKHHLGWPNQSLSIKLADGHEYPAISLGSNNNLYNWLCRVPTPGHTNDGVTYLYGCSDDVQLEKNAQIFFAFCGDLIVNEGLGRTDYSNSSPESLPNSLRTLDGILGPDTLICSAHDYDGSFATLWSDLKEKSEIISEALRATTPPKLNAFLLSKCSQDEKIKHIVNKARGFTCGFFERWDFDSSEFSLSLNELKQKIDQGFAAIIDVRESHEAAFCLNWQKLGIEKKPLNIPASRLVNFLSELAQHHRKDENILLLCKGGTRSLTIARAMHKAGFSNTFNLRYGLASLETRLQYD